MKDQGKSEILTFHILSSEREGEFGRVESAGNKRACTLRPHFLRNHSLHSNNNENVKIPHINHTPSIIQCFFFFTREYSAEIENEEEDNRYRRGVDELTWHFSRNRSRTIVSDSWSACLL